MVYDFQKYKTMRSLGISIWNETTTLEIDINDQAYLRDAIDSFKESARQDSQKKQTKKNSLFTEGKQWVINAFRSGIFPMKTVNIVNDDNNDHYTYVDEMYPKGTLTPRIPAALSVIVDPPWGSTKGKELKYCLQRKSCKDCRCCLHKYKLAMPLIIL